MRAWLLPFLLLAIACSESFAPASSVSDFRVVAARAEVESDPTRANPSPGERVRVSILPIDRGADPPREGSEVPALTPGLLQWAFVACLPLPITIGTPVCGVPIAPCDGCEATPPADLLAFPEMSFQVPSQEELEAASATTVLLQGVLCSNGTPSPDAILSFLSGESDDLIPCQGPPIAAGVPVEGRVLAVSIPIEDDPADPNLHPELLNLLLNGGAWPPPYDETVPRTAPRTGCASDLDGLTDAQREAHPKAGTDPSVIELFVTANSLQTFMVDDRELTEEIQVSWLADGGAFERTFSFITDPASSVLTQWQPFQTAPEDGRLVRFHFVIRDGRGGTDWLERGLCLLPPASEGSPP